MYDHDLGLEPDLDTLRQNVRPVSLDTFIGAETLRSNLRMFIGAAKFRDEALDHVLLHGPPGLGKTTLAHILAAEMGVSMRVTNGPALSKAGDLAALLSVLQAKDVLFIDEVHRTPPAVFEALYPAMEDFCLDILVGEGVAARSLRIDLNPFTLVAATTRSGNLPAPFRDRFGIQFTLGLYSVEMLSTIVMQAGQNLEVSMDHAVAKRIAACARGTPRTALRLLKRIRDYSQYYKVKVTQDMVDQALHVLDIDQNGLNDLDRRYLTILRQRGNRPVGLDTIAALLGEDRSVVEDVIEPYLMQQDYVRRSPRGRVIGLAGHTSSTLDLADPRKQDESKEK